MKEHDHESAREILIDGEHNEPLFLTNEEGKNFPFEQVYVAARCDALYCILRPLVRVEGLRPSAALVFSVDGEGKFRAVTDKEVSEEIFDEFYRALRSERTE